MVETDGSVINEAVTESGQQKWFAFNAVAETTYSIDVDLVTLDDSVLQLIEGDQVTVIAENDDDPFTESTESYIEWTCPQTGLYYAVVRSFGTEDVQSFDDDESFDDADGEDLGTFTISISTAASGGMFGEGGTAGGDPCRGATHAGRWGAHLVNEDNAVCSTIIPLHFWVVANSQTVRIVRRRRVLFLFSQTEITKTTPNACGASSESSTTTLLS